MGKKDPRVDAYIAKAPAFAQPILKHLRKLLHEGCPELSETMKWSRPHFEYHGVLCGMSAFKAHVGFGFWRGREIGAPQTSDAMGGFGRVTQLSDLPSDATLKKLAQKAAALNASGSKRAAPKKAAKKASKMPADLAAALRKAKGALAKWQAFSPSAQREYLEWLADAKQEATRGRRLATTVAQTAEGKSLNWKYQSKRT